MSDLAYAPATGLVFEEQAAVVVSDPNRTDIALFVGFVAVRSGAEAPAAVRTWLESQGWLRPERSRVAPSALLDVPVPVDSWDTFDRLFDWQARPIAAVGATAAAGADENRATTYLGAAVRSFFTQGGRKCYVVRVADPWPVLAPPAGPDRDTAIAMLLPGYPLAFSAAPANPAGWHGMAHLFGLPDVSFVCLPDLADAVGTQPPPPEPATLPAAALEIFTECSDAELGALAQNPTRSIRAPRCSEPGYADWARGLSLAAGALARFAREVQLVAAVPIPLSGTPAAGNLLGFLQGPDRRGGGPLTRGLFTGLDGLASAFVQLTYPWLRTAGSDGLPEGLESPDGVLVGLLARNALTRGAFRSAATSTHAHLADVYDIDPKLSHAQMHRPLADAAGTCRSLIQRVSLFGYAPAGLRLLSDVTTSVQESYRPAAVNRLTSVIVRAARRLGEALTFESSGERLWAEVRSGMASLLMALLQAGALRGATPAEAFSVRCDRSTMTQNDIDAGRVIVEVQFDPAAPVERITVMLALAEGGRVSLVSES